jgi:tryptophan synthase alpha chain
LADGPTIKSSTMALHNGMTSQLLFDQLSTIRESVKIHIIMGYFNPMLQYGIEAFCKKCAKQELMV